MHSSRPRFGGVASAAFGLLGLALAAFGTFAVLSLLVAQRTREIGIRIALGAQRSAVTRMVVTRAMVLVVAGLFPGIACAYGLTRLMESLLYGVSALDPGILTVTALLLCTVALAACLIPARRAATVDPMTALRQE